MDFVTTEFDNVTTEFLSNNLVLVAIGMSCVTTQNFLHLALYTLLPLETVAT